MPIFYYYSIIYLFREIPVEIPANPNHLQFLREGSGLCVLVPRRPPSSASSLTTTPVCRPFPVSQPPPTPPAGNEPTGYRGTQRPFRRPFPANRTQSTEAKIKDRPPVSGFSCWRFFSLSLEFEPRFPEFRGLPARAWTPILPSCPSRLFSFRRAFSACLFI